MKVDKKFTEYLNNIDKSRWSDAGLAVYYKYFGEEEKSRKAFEETAIQGLQYNSKIHPYIYETRVMLDGSRKLVPREMTEKEKQDTEMLIRTGETQLLKGIQYNLAHRKPEYARQLFEWASEVTIVPEEVINKFIEQKRFEYIAQTYLWRGYAFMMLGKYEEALSILKEVVPYFVLYRKSFGRILWHIDYNLSKALIPLCEYKLNPNDANKKKTIKGLNDYMKNIEIYDKIDAYLYYFHLKDTFPYVYSSD